MYTGFALSVRHLEEKCGHSIGIRIIVQINCIRIPVVDPSACDRETNLQKVAPPFEEVQRQKYP
jgi:hypothetical protein